MKRKAIIVGGYGHDGQLLEIHLKKLNYHVILIGKNDFDILNRNMVAQYVASVIPDEIYYLAAYHHSSEGTLETDDILFKNSFDINVVSPSYFLDAITQYAPSARFFYASSSHIYSDYLGTLQTEDTPPNPKSIYAITKYSGMLTCKYYRNHRNIFVACGILYNHESSLRPQSFLSRKVAKSVAEIYKNKEGSLIVGSLDIEVDWGYAPDYVDAMHRMLQLKNPGDYIISSGKAHTVKQLVEIAFSYVGLNYKDYVSVQPALINQSSETRIGDASRLMKDTNWKPTIGFKEIIEKMVDAELELL
ncbi:GDP-mannose 4,6-dehydratase [Candidatus Pseudothioglobus singularis]|nr:GDP-mannose 4,6-dehydratase [Candidatus Pseudothioglobus singularis]